MVYYDKLYFDTGIEKYLPTLRRLGWTQPLLHDWVYIGDLTQEQVDAVIDALDEVDKFGFSIAMVGVFPD